jgi:hypothetical protein
MANTRNRVANEKNDNNNANPPAPPTLEKVLIMQAQLLHTMQQTMANMQQAPQYQPAPQQQPCDKLGELTFDILSLCQAHGCRRLVEDSRKEATSCLVQQ